MSDAIDSESKHLKHLATVERKAQRIAGKQAILDTWMILSEKIDADYVRDLKKRIRQTAVNFEQMRP